MNFPEGGRREVPGLRRFTPAANERKPRGWGYFKKRKCVQIPAYRGGEIERNPDPYGWEFDNFIE